MTLVAKPTVGCLRVLSKPEGASVYLNGTFAGTTPLSLNLTPGEYRVKVVSGKGEVVRSVSVPRKGCIEVTITFPTSTPRKNQVTQTKIQEHHRAREKKHGICGPASLIAVSLVPLIVRKLKR